MCLLHLRYTFVQKMFAFHGTVELLRPAFLGSLSLENLKVLDRVSLGHPGPHLVDAS
jgi:hypothetical protein